MATLVLLVPLVVVVVVYVARLLVHLRRARRSFSLVDAAADLPDRGRRPTANKKLCKQKFDAALVPQRLDAIVVGSGASINASMNRAAQASAAWRRRRCSVAPAGACSSSSSTASPAAAVTRSPRAADSVRRLNPSSQNSSRIRLGHSLRGQDARGEHQLEAAQALDERRAALGVPGRQLRRGALECGVLYAHR